MELEEMNEESFANSAQIQADNRETINQDYNLNS